jgi:glutaredoxin 2
MIRKRNLRSRVSSKNSNRALYESIMRDVVKTVKRHLNENLDESKIKNSIRFLINEYINLINKCEMPYFNEFFCGGLQVISCKSNDSYIDILNIYDDNYENVMEDAENLIINAPKNINICFRLH